MSKANEDLRKIIESMSQEVSVAKPQITPSVPSIEASVKVRALLVLIGTGLVGNWIGLIYGNPTLMAFASAACLVGLISLGIYIWRGRLPFVGQGVPDITVEVLKRRSLELERDRLRNDLEESHQSIQGLNQTILTIREELGREKTSTAEAVARRETQLRKEFEANQRNWFETEKQRLETLTQETAQKEKSQEQFLTQETLHLKQELAGRERKLNELSEKVVQLQDALDRKLVTMPAELAEHTAALEKQFEQERQMFRGRLQDQETAYQNKLDATEENRTQQKLEMEKKLEEFSRRNLQLQEALEKKVISTSSDMAGHIEQIKVAFSMEKGALQKQILDQEARHQKQLAGQEAKFNSNKMELLTACESFLEELEAKERYLEQKERTLKGKSSE